MEEAEYEETYGTDEEEEEESEEDTEEEEDGYVYLISEQKIEFDAAMDALDALSIDSFTDEGSTETLEMSMTLSFDDEEYPTVSIELYQYDSDSCLAVVDGEVIGLVSRSSMVDLREELTGIVLGLE